MSKFAHDDPNILWVSAAFEGKGNGTFDAPFTDIGRAVKRAQPGNTVVLKAGEYHGNVSIHDSGTVTQPVRIVADDGVDSHVCCRSGWYFYDVSDIIVSGISFKDVPHQALSVIGACERNSFSGLRFVNCGLDKTAPCTFFFGGSGAQCNVVENCIFEIDTKHYSTEISDLPIGLMISEGDTEENSDQNINHIFRRNSFTHYGCAIVVGTHDDQSRNYSHIVEHNVIRNCSCDGIRIKCGDTVVRGNVLQNCLKNGISITHGNTDFICDNRIEECETGVNVAGYDCTLTNNCIIRSGRQAISIVAKSDGSHLQRGNTVIELNTCIDSGMKCDSSSCGNILLDTNSYCIIRRNIFHGEGKPYIVGGFQDSTISTDKLHVADNKISGGCLPIKGCSKLDISFIDRESGNYSNDSGYGAAGWMAESSEIPYMETAESLSYRNANCPESSFSKGSDDEKELYTRSLFLKAQENIAEEKEDSATNNSDDDGIVDFSDWDI